MRINPISSRSQKRPTNFKNEKKQEIFSAKNPGDQTSFGMAYNLIIQDAAKDLMNKYQNKENQKQI